MSLSYLFSQTISLTRMSNQRLRRVSSSSLECAQLIHTRMYDPMMGYGVSILSELLAPLTLRTRRHLLLIGSTTTPMRIGESSRPDNERPS